MKQALGLVEIAGLSTAVVAADAMAKAANIQIVEVENTKGLGYMTIKAIGDVGAVKAAVDVGRQVGTMHGCLVSCKVIPRPSDYVEKFFAGPDDGAKRQPEAEREDREAVSEEKAAEPEMKEEDGGAAAEENSGKAESEPVLNLEQESKPAPNPEQEPEPALNPAPESALEPETPPKSNRKKGTAKKKESGQNETG